jgi:hypothetical protein
VATTAVHTIWDSYRVARGVGVDVLLDAAVEAVVLVPADCRGADLDHGRAVPGVVDERQGRLLGLGLRPPAGARGRDHVPGRVVDGIHPGRLVGQLRDGVVGVEVDVVGVDLVGVVVVAVLVDLLGAGVGVAAVAVGVEAVFGPVAGLGERPGRPADAVGRGDLVPTSQGSAAGGASVLPATKTLMRPVFAIHLILCSVYDI